MEAWFRCAAHWVFDFVMLQHHDHFGANEKMPTIAPPTTNSAGLILYCSKIISTPTAMVAVSRPAWVERSEIADQLPSRQVQAKITPVTLDP